VYLFEVKKPAESKYPGDFYKLRADHRVRANLFDGLGPAEIGRAQKNKGIARHPPVLVPEILGDNCAHCMASHVSYASLSSWNDMISPAHLLEGTMGLCA